MKPRDIDETIRRARDAFKGRTNFPRHVLDNEQPRPPLRQQLW